jgi:hypothetical protein
VQQKHNPATIEQRYNTKEQQKHNPDTIEQRYNTKIEQKHNPATTEQRYNTKYNTNIIQIQQNNDTTQNTTKT